MGLKISLLTLKFMPKILFTKGKNNFLFCPPNAKKQSSQMSKEDHIFIEKLTFRHNLSTLKWS